MTEILQTARFSTTLGSHTKPSIERERRSRLIEKPCDCLRIEPRPHCASRKCKHAGVTWSRRKMLLPKACELLRRTSVPPKNWWRYCVHLEKRERRKS